MILQVHDELVFDALKTEVPQLKILIKEAMESVFVSKVPLTVDIGEGATWLEAH
jgi:DNA polymerase-1